MPSSVLGLLPSRQLFNIKYFLFYYKLEEYKHHVFININTYALFSYYLLPISLKNINYPLDNLIYL